MATQYLCDRCKKPQQSSIVALSIIQGMSYQYGLGQPNYLFSVEWCGDCLKELGFIKEEIEKADSVEEQASLFQRLRDLIIGRPHARP